MAFVPEKNGTILDVACGKGATTRYLLKYYTPENVTGIMREKFLGEALRVLKPGGCLVLADILVNQPRGTRPAANQVRDMMEYRDLYKCGNPARR